MILESDGFYIIYKKKKIIQNDVEEYLIQRKIKKVNVKVIGSKSGSGKEIMDDIMLHPQISGC